MSKYLNHSRDELLQEIAQLTQKLAISRLPNTHRITAGEQLSFLKQQQLQHNPLATKRTGGNRKEFSFGAYAARPIALKVAYCGWNYYGLTCQDGDLVDTIELHLFKALITSKLIPGHRDCRWSRSGRTDRGVSSFGQVVSLFIRSNLPIGTPGTTTWPLSDDTQDCELCEEGEKELPYITMLNRALPNDIRVLSWAPVNGAFDSRFSCTSRLYKYYFLGDGLNIDKMNQAAALLVGDHDFRNFCKIDLQRINRPFGRTIHEASVFDLETDSRNHPQFKKGHFHVFCIKGSGFLWHQVRCIMAILLLIGQERETPDLVTQLLDVEAVKGKPVYEMADELPLVLVECGYNNIRLVWQGDFTKSETDEKAIRVIMSQWKDVSVKQNVLMGLIGHEFGECTIPFQPYERRQRGKEYVKVLKRSRNATIEEIIEKMGRAVKNVVEEMP